MTWLARRARAARPVKGMTMNTVIRRLASAAAGLTAIGLLGPAGAVVTGPAAISGGVVHIVHVAGARVNTNTSNNWSGYNIGANYPGYPAGTAFTSISGTWTVPTATQHVAGQAENSATWVGIGGGCVTSNCSVTDNTLIQAGTEQDVSASGTASYGAWWEIIPEPQTTVPLPVSPGDTVKVTIAQTGVPGTWSIVIADVTTGQQFATTTPYASSMSTAEWIEETPLQIGTGGTGLTAMPNLGTVGFTGATLNGAGAGLQTVDEMQLVTSGGQVVATPSGPGTGLTSFNDCTWQTACAAP